MILRVRQKNLLKVSVGTAVRGCQGSRRVSSASMCNRMCIAPNFAPGPENDEPRSSETARGGGLPVVISIVTTLSPRWARKECGHGQTKWYAQHLTRGLSVCSNIIRFWNGRDVLFSCITISFVHQTPDALLPRTLDTPRLRRFRFSYTYCALFSSPPRRLKIIFSPENRRRTSPCLTLVTLECFPLTFDSFGRRVWRTAVENRSQFGNAPKRDKTEMVETWNSYWKRKIRVWKTRTC